MLLFEYCLLFIWIKIAVIKNAHNLLSQINHLSWAVHACALFDDIKGVVLLLYIRDNSLLIRWSDQWVYHLGLWCSYISCILISIVITLISSEGFSTLICQNGRVATFLVIFKDLKLLVWHIVALDTASDRVILLHAILMAGHFAHNAATADLKSHELGL